jgi:hypothetical protein
LFDVKHLPKRGELANFGAILLIAVLSFYGIALAMKVPFSVYYASTDYFIAVNNYLSHAQPINNQNTAQTRSLGYPVFLYLASGGGLNIASMAIAQLLLAFLAPLIAALVLWREGFSPVKIAFFISPILLSFVFYAPARTLLNEQLYAVALWAMFIAAFLWYSRKSRPYFIALCVFWIIAVFTRATALPLLPIIVFLFPFKNWLARGKIFVLSLVGLVLVVTFLNSLHRQLIPNYTSGFGLFAMMNPMVVSREREAWRLRSDDGPASARLISMVEDYEATPKGQAGIENHRKRMKVDEAFITQLQCETDAAARPPCLLETPTLETYWQVKWIAIRGLGISDANALMTSVLLEQMRHKPLLFFRYWSRNMALFLAGGNYHYSYLPAPERTMVKKNGFQILHVKNSVDRYKKFFQPDFEAEMGQINAQTSARNLSKINRFISPFWRYLFWSNLLVLPIGIYFGLKRLFDGRTHSQMEAIIVLAVVIFGFHAAAISFVHPPLGRYVFPLLPVVSFGLSATALLVGTMMGELFERVKNSRT